MTEKAQTDYRRRAQAVCDRIITNMCKASLSEIRCFPTDLLIYRYNAVLPKKLSTVTPLHAHLRRGIKARFYQLFAFGRGVDP